MKLLITGASGFLGQRIVSNYQDRYQCIIPPHHELDILNKTSCMNVIAQSAPDYVIHTAAVSDTGTCERDPQMSYQVNVMGAENLAKACAAGNSRLIFTSSDQVYNGNDTTIPNYEDDQCRPINVYGRQKLEAEQRIRKVLPDVVILRLTWLYDLPEPQLSTKANFLTRILDALEKQQIISFSDKEYRGITYVREVVDNLEYSFKLPGGIYNFGSYPKATTYQLARQVMEMIGADERVESLVGVQADALPRNLAMDQKRQLQHNLHFSENWEGILKCLKEKKH